MANIPDPILNSAGITYAYTVDPSLPDVTSEAESNTVTTRVSMADLEIMKETDKTYADLDEVITYTLRVRNTGNTDANNVVIHDTIQANATFVAGSVTVDGVAVPSGDPPSGIALQSIAVGDAKVITFQVKAAKIADIVNAATGEYKYTVDPAKPNDSNADAESNEVVTVINHGEISNPSGGLIKSVDKASATIGDFLTYRFFLKNTGNTPVNNVRLRDVVPPETTFVANSLTRDDVSMPGATIAPPGYLIGTLQPGASTIITFKVEVVSVPAVNPIENYGTVSYTYTVDPQHPDGVHAENDSNIVATVIGRAVIDYEDGKGLIKSVDKAYAKLGDIINYTITLKNTGNIKADNIVYTDPIPEGSTFITDSVVVNGTPMKGLTVVPPAGVSIGSLNPDQESTIVFQVKVTSIPANEKIINQGHVRFTYTLDDKTILNGTGDTNIVETLLQYAQIDYENGHGLVKSEDREVAEMGDTVTYSFVIQNTGNVAANKVVFTDSIPNGMEFVENSLTYNGTALSSRPDNGVILGTLPPGVSNTLSFKAKITSTPSVNPIPDTAQVDYTFTTNPSQPNGEHATGTSNTVYIKYVVAGLDEGDVVKSADKLLAKKGDTITYRFVITNKNAIALKNVVLHEEIPENTEFVSDSVTINGVLQPSYDPISGISVETLKSGASIVVTFKVKVIGFPENGEIHNIANVTYTYTIDPDFPDIDSEIDSNEVIVEVKEPIIDNLDGGYVKAVDKEYAKIGDILTYTLMIKNTGNIAANHCVVTDVIPPGTALVPGSVVIDGMPYPDINSMIAVSIGSIDAGMAVNMKFQVIVESIVGNGIIKNKATIAYDYVAVPGQPSIPKTGETNEVETKVNSSDFSGDNFVKISDPKYVLIGDVITFTFKIKNTGNAAANNVIFKDVLEDALQFVTGSVQYNGLTLRDADPNIGFFLGNIEAGVSSMLTFQAKAIKRPASNPVTNVGTLDYTTIVDPGSPPEEGHSDSNKTENIINDVDVEVKKTSDKEIVAVGERIHYSFTVQNKGDTDVTDVFVIDRLVSELEFVPESVTIDGISYKNLDITRGFSIGAMKVGESKLVTFQAKVIGLPADKKVSNKVNADVTFILDPEKPPKTKTEESNEVEVEVEKAELTLTKTADIECGKLDEIVTYTLLVDNTGTVTAKNITVYDKLSTQLEFVLGSVILNETALANADIVKGVGISSLEPGQKAVIKYQAKIIGGIGMSDFSGTVTNSAYADFRYSLKDGSEERNGTSNTSSVDIKVVNPIFTQINLDGCYEIPCIKPDMEDIDDLEVTVKITDYQIIKTPKGRAVDNTILTGIKLLITGEMMQILEYTAKDELQTVHSAHYTKQFSVFIVLPGDIGTKAKLEFRTNIEDIYVKKMSEKTFFSNITLIISAAVSKNC